jgi:hypothetical protein
MEAIPGLERRGGSLRAVISVASKSMTSQPASSFPSDGQPRNPAGVAPISDQTWSLVIWLSGSWQWFFQTGR